MPRLTRRNAHCGCPCCPADLSAVAESPAKVRSSSSLPPGRKGPVSGRISSFERVLNRPLTTPADLGPQFSGLHSCCLMAISSNPQSPQDEACWVQFPASVIAQPGQRDDPGLGIGENLANIGLDEETE